MSSLERGGWVQPEAQKSKSMEVEIGGFETSGKGAMKLFVGIQIKSIPNEAHYLRIFFPDARTKKSKEARVIRLKGTKSYTAKSSPMKGLKYLDAYPVVIQLTSDREGRQVIEQLTQYVRFQLPPAAQAQLGINQ